MNSKVMLHSGRRLRSSWAEITMMSATTVERLLPRFGAVYKRRVTGGRRYPASRQSCLYTVAGRNNRWRFRAWLQFI
jgi:ABC-type anion transport system duplicated permease subunit